MNKEKFINTKSLWILGVGRLQKDFQYVFDDLNIQGYIYDDIAANTWFHKPIYTLREFFRVYNGEAGIIVCSWEKDKYGKLLNQYGLLYGDDYFFAEDLFCLLDYPIQKYIHNRPVALWGTGKYAEEFMENCPDGINLDYVIDNNIVNNKTFYQKEVFQLKEVLEKSKDVYIIIGSSHYIEIKDQLINAGLKEEKDFVYAQIIEPISKWFKATYMDQNYYELNCHSMLGHMDIGRSVFPCCATFITRSIGNLEVQDIDRIWNSKIHRVLAVSILNKTFSFCKHNMCLALLNIKRENYVEKYDENSYSEIMAHATVVSLGFDDTCNLYCKTCRNKLRVATGIKKTAVNIVSKKILNDIVPFTTQLLTMSGAGEVFFSEAYRRIWESDKSKNSQYFQLFSNGLLFNKKNWISFSENRSSQILLCFSVDAATAETYEKIRRGGNWQQLEQNLKFAAELRERQAVKYFRINFVVQRENYQEIPLFIEWAKKLHVDRILFTRLINWGTYTDEEYQQASMTDESGEPNAELKQILELPICRDKIVDLGTIHGMHKYNKVVGNIDNYYLWEINNYIGILD